MAGASPPQQQGAMNRMVHQACKKQEEAQGFLCIITSHVGRQVWSHLKVLPHRWAAGFL